MHKTLLVLGLLRPRPLHGYELHRIVRAHGELYTDLKKANLYYLLDRLARDGYLDVQVEPGARGPRGERLIYTITEKGRAYFENLLRGVLRTYEPVHTGIDVAVVLLEHLPLSEAITLLEERRSIVAYRRDLVARGLGNSASHGLLESIAADHLLALIDSELAWIDRSLQRLREAEKNPELVQSDATHPLVNMCPAKEEKAEE
jgi:DNA-binding PadR family transcriptional regulator